MHPLEKLESLGFRSVSLAQMGGWGRFRKEEIKAPGTSSPMVGISVTPVPVISQPAPPAKTFPSLVLFLPLIFPCYALLGFILVQSRIRGRNPIPYDIKPNRLSRYALTLVSPVVLRYRPFLSPNSLPAVTFSCFVSKGKIVLWP